MKRVIKVLSVLLVIGIASTAHALVTFDNQTGIGFVGKGDVQLAFDWNNQKLNLNAGGVSFSVRGRVEQDYVCSYLQQVRVGTGQSAYWTTVPATATKDVQKPINDTVAYDARKNSVTITGFTLTGYAPGGEMGNLVNVGDACKVQSYDGTVSSVGTPVLVGANLFTTYNGTSIQLSY